MDIRNATAWVALGFMALLGAVLLYRIFTGRIDLTRLVSEPTGDASMSRFQLLIFTYVIAVSFFLIIVSQTPANWPHDMPPGVLTLLGISASSYLVSKGIQFSQPSAVEDRPPQVTVTPAHVTLAPGSRYEFKAHVTRTDDATVMWSLLPPFKGDIDATTGVYTAPLEAPPEDTVVTVRATSVSDSSAFGSATITFAPPRS